MLTGLPTPQPVLHTSDLHCGLVEVPFTAASRQPPADLVRGGLDELVAPLPSVDPLRGSTMADCNAIGGEDLIDMAQAQRKAEIEPEGVTDDLNVGAVIGSGYPS